MVGIEETMRQTLGADARIHLHVLVSNATALRFYARAGYTSCGEVLEKVPLKDGSKIALQMVRMEKNNAAMCDVSGGGGGSGGGSGAGEGQSDSGASMDAVASKLDLPEGDHGTAAAAAAAAAMGGEKPSVEFDPYDFTDLEIPMPDFSSDDEDDAPPPLTSAATPAPARAGSDVAVGEEQQHFAAVTSDTTLAARCSQL
jgi:hypothetical protein